MAIAHELRIATASKLSIPTATKVSPLRNTPRTSCPSHTKGHYVQYCYSSFPPGLGNCNPLTTPSEPPPTTVGSVRGGDYGRSARAFQETPSAHKVCAEHCDLLQAHAQLVTCSGQFGASN
jgi:hypothetical protein